MKSDFRQPCGERRHRLPHGYRLAAVLHVSLLIIATLGLAACNGVLNLPFLQPQASATAPALISTPAPTPSSAPSPEVVQTAAPVLTLTVWLPPQFNPNADTPAAQRLRARLEQFSVENPGVELDVRIKALSGPAGIIESMTAASAAAPEALPALVALPRESMELAALKGLIFPLEDPGAVLDGTDWFDYARQLAAIQGSVFGLPFAGDTLALLYRPTVIARVPATWDGMASLGQPLIFPAADPQARLTTLLYLSAGGTLSDDQDRPTLQTDPLMLVYRLYGNGARSGAFPNWLDQFASDEQAWQAYQEQRAPWAVVWASHFLGALPADTQIAALPALGEQPAALATGWLWCLADSRPEQRQWAQRLAEYLVESEFMSAWTADAGFIPTRPSALAAWKNQSLQTLLNPLALTAKIAPPPAINNNIGPILQETGLQVIDRELDAVQAAQAAVQRLEAPPKR